MCRLMSKKGNSVSVTVDVNWSAGWKFETKSMKAFILAYLDEVLAPFVTTLPTYVKDTNHALHTFDSFRFYTSEPGHRFLFTMDVKSLYTVIPNDCGLQALTYFLDKRDIKDPSTSTLTRFAELVLTLNLFSFNNEYYRQIGGVAMGSKIGTNYVPVYSLVMLNSKSGNSTQLHKRYVDDIVGAASCTREELEAFIDFVSNFHPALQFTSTVTETDLPFLDINLHISDDKIQTSVYYKETDTNNYLHFSSFHPDHCIRAILYSQFLLLRRLCSDDDDFLVRSRKMLTFFKLRGYPCASLENDLRRVVTIKRPDALRLSEQIDRTVDSASGSHVPPV